MTQFALLGRAHAISGDRDSDAGVLAHRSSSCANSIHWHAHWGSALIGIGVGVGWIVIAAAILFAGGWMHVSDVQSVGQLPIWLIALFLNTTMQELLVRGYLYQRLRQSFNIPVTAVVSTTLFLLCHGGALEAGWLPCANIVLMSLFVIAVLEYTGSLIGACFSFISFEQHWRNFAWRCFSC